VADDRMTLCLNLVIKIFADRCHNRNISFMDPTVRKQQKIDQMCYGLPRVEGEGRRHWWICTGGRQGFRPWGCSPTAGQEDDLFLLASHRHTPLSLYRKGPTNGLPRPTRPLTVL
jgi:hypothetical protein